MLCHPSGQTHARVRGRRALSLAAAIVACAGSATVVAATPQEQQLALAGAGAVKLVVRGAGWLRVSQPDLVAAGVSPTVDPAMLQLFADGVEQAIVVTGNADASFTADEAIEFYGTGRDTLWTDARTYWLIAGAAGARVPVQAPAPGAAAPTSFLHSERLVEHKNYVAAILNGDETNFFAAAVGTTPTVETLTVRHLDVGAATMAVLRVSLQGATASAHAVDVSLDGQLLGTCTLGERDEATCSFSAPNVVEGDNQVTLVSHGAADASALESVELSYPHTYAADGDALLLTAPAATRVAITGFSAPSVRVVDVTDASHPIELGVTVTAAGAANTARVDTPAATGPRTLYAFSAANIGKPSSVAADQASSWAASHDGELVILSHASFMSALEPLVSRRVQEGWTVQLVDLQDVYDEFGGGDKTVFAIRDFLQSARAHWRVPPRFVLLVGDATFDPRNFLGLGDFDFAPTKLIDTSEMETASDDWFVDADLDGVPEIAIGRIPVRTKDEAAAVVQKTLAYAGTADLPRGGLFVTDQNDPDVDFEAASALSEAKVSDIMPIDRFQRSQPGATSAALLAKLDGGPFLVNYFGHGSVEIWDDLLTSTQAATLTNATSSIYVVMNCLNGFFHDLYTESLAEALLKAPQGGAVAVWASSTLAEFTPQPAYNQAFLMNLSRTSLGETALQAKQSITDAEARRTWILFGDPTLFGKPQAAPSPDGGANDGPVASDAAMPIEAGASDAGVDAGPATGDSAGDSASPDSASPDSASPDSASPDVTMAMDGATFPDADGSADASFKSPPSGAGCGCALDGSSSGGRGGLGLLMLALLATIRRRPRRGPLGLLGLTLTLTLTSLAWAPSAQAAYGFRKALTIDRTRIGTAGGATTLTNYPLLINMTDAVLKNAGAGHVQSANGYDIAFTGADAATCGAMMSPCTFNYEIEKYDGAAGQVIAWVQIPSLNTAAASSNTVIYVKYGDATIAAPTQNANATWDASFKGVWHFSQSPVATQNDSTATAANATANGAPTPAVVASAEIGPGVSTSGTTGTGYFDYLSTAFNWTSADTFTYSGWFNTADLNGPLVSQRDNATGKPDIDIAVGFDGVHSSPGSLVALVRDDSGASFAFVTGSTICSDSNWHLFTLTRTGGTIQLYLDGVSQGSNSNAGASSNITTGAAGNFQNIGREGNWVSASYGTTDQEYLAASFDEYRISNTVRSTDWLTTDYNTQSAPASTFTAGGEALASCGDGSVGTGETCDDGNISSGDGCSTTCTIETGYSCSGSPSSCSTTCGDGVAGGAEGCDDGNLTNGDGCSSTCAIETAYHCMGTPSVCVFARFDFYKPITINQAQVGGGSAPATLSNYPILFSVTDPSLKTTTNLGHVRNANGYDIVFRGEDTTTCGGPTACTFAHEIEKYDGTTGQLIAWVKIPGLKTQTAAASTSIKVLYGNMAISTTTEQRTSVWDASFKAVWHLNQDPTGTAPQMKDSTSNGNDGTSTALTTAAAEVGSGVSTDGSTSFMAFNSGSSLNSGAGGAFTYSTWINTSDTFGSLLSFRRSADGNPVIDVMVGFDGSMMASGSLLALVRDNAGALGEVNGGAINDGTWHYVTLTRSGSTVTLYLDKTSMGTAAAGGAITSDIRNLGREGYWTTIMPAYTSAGNEFLAGTFDEVRASSTARSIDWVTTDFNAQSSPSTFITSGSEVAADVHTNVDLVSFDATELCEGTTIAWQTAYEVDTLGFNVFRDAGGARVQLNAALVPGAGLSGGDGHRYEIVDPGPFDASRTYALEEVHLSLQSSWFGPLGPSVSPGCGRAAQPASTSLVGSSNGAAMPVAAASASPSPNTAPAELGGCSLGGRGAQRPEAVLFAAAIFALARRRRRAR